MSILHRRRNIKRRWLAREAKGERTSQPHEFERASARECEGAPAVAQESPPAAPVRRKRKAKAKRKARAS